MLNASTSEVVSAIKMSGRICKNYLLFIILFFKQENYVFLLKFSIYNLRVMELNLFYIIKQLASSIGWPLNFPFYSRNFFLPIVRIVAANRRKP